MRATISFTCFIVNSGGTFTLVAAFFAGTFLEVFGLAFALGATFFFVCTVSYF
jgi:hypothetical protein